MKILLTGLALALSAFQPTPLYTVEVLKLDEPGCKQTCSHFELEYPKLLKAGNAAALARIQQALQKALLETLTIEKPSPDLPAAIQAFFSEATGFHKEAPDAPAWEMQATAAVHFYSERIVSLRLESYLFAGGAHGLPGTRFLNFDLQTGEPLKLADLLLPDAMAKVKQLGEKQFRQDKELPEEQRLQELGFDFEKDGFYLPDNVGIGRFSLTFFYNVYEIGPYVAGTTELTLPYYELAPLLKPEWRKLLAP